MSQSRRHSILESTINVALGVIISWTFTFLVFKTTPEFALAITLSYSALSWVRSYTLRRVFNRLGRPGWSSMKRSELPYLSRTAAISPNMFRKLRNRFYR